jgi:hypothetical protein
MRSTTFAPPVGFSEPLHVRHPVAHAERAQYAAPERDPGLDVRLREIADRQHDRRHPFLRAHFESVGEVLRDALVDRLAADAQRVVGELLAGNELLDADLVDVAQ